MSSGETIAKSTTEHKTTPSNTSERKIIYSAMISVDGYFEGPNQSLDWPIIDEEIHRFANQQQDDIDTNIFGRRMYQVMSFWDTIDDDSDVSEVEREFARSWKQQTKIVFSQTLDTVQHNARLATSDLASEVADLKRQPGKHAALGGAELAASAFKLGLIDEVHLFIHPVMLGSGKPCFPLLDSHINLELIESKVFRSGVVYLRYRCTNPPEGAEHQR